MPRVDLRDKPILITGASSGIGRATAIACAAADMPVLLCARREEKLRSLAAQIIADGGRATPVLLDVRDPERCRHAIQTCLDTYSSIYAVFANAGYGYERTLHDTPIESLRDIFEVNLFGSLNIIKPALPHLIKQERGHVLLCSSCLSHLPVPSYGAYSATKASQHHIGRALRVELAHHNVHVSTVHPIGTNTEFFETAIANSPGGAPMIDRPDSRFMQPPERVASQIVRSLAAPRPEVWTSHSARILFKLSTLTPRLTDAFLRRRLEP
ncbi:MAG: SDR family NAD(P)-dependent oxidoreductase [Planctomycetota bacterium]|jgi:short-subunit dehydrogenase